MLEKAVQKACHASGACPSSAEIAACPPLLRVKAGLPFRIRRFRRTQISSYDAIFLIVMKKKINNIFFVVGLAAVVIMCFTFDVSLPELWSHLQRAGYWMAAILGLWAVLYMLNALTWRIIIRGSGACTVSFPRLLKLTVSGFALNYATPMGLMGGEPYRIMELSRNIGTDRATSSVVLFAMMHIFSHFWFWITAIVTYLLMAAAGLLPLDTGMAVVLFLSSLFCGGGVYLFLKGYRNGMILRLCRLLGRLPGLRRRGARFLEHHRDDLQRIDSQIAGLHGQNRRSFYASLLLEYFGRMLQCFEILFMLLLFGIDNGGGPGGLLVTYLHSFLILAFTSLFANLLGFLPLQLGGREGGFAMSVAQLGMTGSVGIFVSIICRVRELFWAAAGILLMKVGNHKT